MKFYLLKGSYEVFKTLNRLKPFRLGAKSVSWYENMETLQYYRC